jgi:hypothetical protein
MTKQQLKDILDRVRCGGQEALRQVSRYMTP